MQNVPSSKCERLWTKDKIHDIESLQDQAPPATFDGLEALASRGQDLEHPAKLRLAVRDLKHPTELGKN
jgi:hypothetical protein